NYESIRARLRREAPCANRRPPPRMTTNRAGDAAACLYRHARDSRSHRSIPDDIERYYKNPHNVDCLLALRHVILVRLQQSIRRTSGGEKTGCIAEGG